VNLLSLGTGRSQTELKQGSKPFAKAPQEFDSIPYILIELKVHS
jgi:hypothetical protein